MRRDLFSLATGTMTITNQDIISTSDDFVSDCEQQEHQKEAKGEVDSSVHDEENDPQKTRSSRSFSLCGWLLVLLAFLWWVNLNPLHDMAFEAHQSSGYHRRLRESGVTFVLEEGFATQSREGTSSF